MDTETKKRPALLRDKKGEERPYKVNEWYNAETDVTTEVWFNGKDGFNIYWENERVDTIYIPDLKEWGKNKCFLLAVGEACRIGYRLAFHKEFEG